MKLPLGPVPVLTVLFTILKLCGVIHWSWWLVLLPLWIIPAIVLAVAGVGLAVIVTAIMIVMGIEVLFP